MAHLMLLILVALTLAACYEPASTWDSHRGRFVSTDEYRRDEINREIDKRKIQRERRERGE